MCNDHGITNGFNGLNHLNYGYFDELDCNEGAHHPQLLKIGCWDARIDGRLHALPLGKIFNHRSAGATLPQNVLWDPNLHGYLSLSDLKQIKQIVIAPHSDCLAARTALNFPREGDIPTDHPQHTNLQVIHHGLRVVGANLKDFSDRCWDEARGHELNAVNLMAKRLAITSLGNLMEYKVCKDGTKTVGESVIDNEMNVAVVFVDIQRKQFEYLSLDTKEFHPLVPETAPAHMCVRKNDCEGCHCGEQVGNIAQAIQFYDRGHSLG